MIATKLSANNLRWNVNANASTTTIDYSDNTDGTSKLNGRVTSKTKSTTTSNFSMNSNNTKNNKNKKRNKKKKGQKRSKNIMDNDNTIE